MIMPNLAFFITIALAVLLVAVVFDDVVAATQRVSCHMALNCGGAK